MVDYDQVFLILKVSNYVFLFFALIFSIYFVRIVNAAKSMHSNLRCLLILVSLEFRCLGVSRAIAEIVESFVPSTVTSNVVCVSMSILNAGSMGSTQLSFLSILVERSIATYFHSNYDNWENKLARGFVIIELVYAFLFGLRVYQMDVEHTMNGDPQLYNGTCVSLTRQPMLLIYSWAVFGAIFILASFPMFLVYKHNKKLSKLPGTGTLTTRYQHNDNALVLRIFLPLFIIGVFCVGSFCSSIIFYIFIRLQQGNVMTVKEAILIRVTFFLTDICCTMYEYQFLRAHPVLKSLAKKKRWKFLRSSSLKPTTVYENRNTAANDTSVYFNQFSLAWK